MSFSKATKSFFIRWLDFQGRSSRSEYWWGLLGVCIITFIVAFIIAFTLMIMGASENQINLAILPWQIFTGIGGLALAIRRLHDLDKSGWWYLIAFTIIGLIPLFIWYCTKGTEGPNRFGEDSLS